MTVSRLLCWYERVDEVDTEAQEENVRFDIDVLHRLIVHEMIADIMMECLEMQEALRSGSVDADRWTRWMEVECRLSGEKDGALDIHRRLLQKGRSDLARAFSARMSYLSDMFYRVDAEARALLSGKREASPRVDPIANGAGREIEQDKEDEIEREWDDCSLEECECQCQCAE